MNKRIKSTKRTQDKYIKLLINKDVDTNVYQSSTEETQNHIKTSLQNTVKEVLCPKENLIGNS